MSPTGFLSDFDPFLLLDELGPRNLRPREAKGAADHPHPGFETVSKVTCFPAMGGRDKMTKPRKDSCWTI